MTKKEPIKYATVFSAGWMEEYGAYAFECNKNGKVISDDQLIETFYFPSDYKAEEQAKELLKEMGYTIVPWLEEQEPPFKR